MNFKQCTSGILVFDKYHDLPDTIQKFGEHIISHLNSPERGLIEHATPLNQLGDKMFSFDKDSEIEYCVIAGESANDHTRELAFHVINRLSDTGIIYRYDMEDGTLFYVSFEC